MVLSTTSLQKSFVLVLVFEYFAISAKSVKVKPIIKLILVPKKCKVECPHRSQSHWPIFQLASINKLNLARRKPQNGFQKPLGIT